MGRAALALGSKTETAAVTRYLVILAIACIAGVLSPIAVRHMLASNQDRGSSWLPEWVASARPPDGSLSGDRRALIRAHASGHFLARAEINSQPMTVMVDTGATVVVLTAEDARRAGVSPAASEFTVPVRTANGLAHTARVQLRHVRVGPVRVRNVEALVSRPGDLSTTLLGMAFLSRLRQVSIRDGEMLLVQ